VDELAKFLDRYPNAVVDMAARMSNLQYQSNADRDRVRDFLIRYQDRILYATDLTLNPPSEEAKAQNPPIDPTANFAQVAEQVWRSDWTYLATRESQYVSTLKSDTQGLGLPKAVIRKIYYENAVRTLRR
jgi:predicted TIM-barrel fold metal-dependent hydrolase